LKYTPGSDSISSVTTLDQKHWGWEAFYDSSTNKVHLVQGWQANNFSNFSFSDAWIYDVTGNSFTLRSLLLGDGGAAAVYAPTTQKVYSFGGNYSHIREYDPATNRVYVKDSALGDALTRPAAVWSSSQNKIYIFGGVGGDYSNVIYSYNPSNDTVTQLTATLPSGVTGISAVWSDTTNKAYIFGGYDGAVSLDQVIEFDPAANGGNGSTTVKSATLPSGRYDTAAIWYAPTNTAYIFGGTDDNNNDLNSIVAYSIGGDTTSLPAFAMPFPATGISAVWDDTIHRALVYGVNNNIFEFNPANGVSFSRQTSNACCFQYSASAWIPTTGHSFVLGGQVSNWTYDVVDNTPTADAYYSSGTIHYLFTPSAGTTYDWSTASYNATENGGTVSLQYTTNTDCTTGLTSTFTSLADSESVCIVASISTTDSYITPTLDDLTVSYSIVGGGPTPTPTPTATPTPTPTPTVDTPTPTPTPCTPPPGAPVPPNTVKVTDLGNGSSLIVTWINVDTCQVSVVIERRDATCTTIQDTITAQEAERYVADGLQTGTTYCFVLKAVGPNGTSPPTTGVTGTPTKNKLPKTGRQ
jgi:hypothetical protein